MRRLVFAALVSLFAFGCATATTRQSNAQKMRSLYDAFARGDVPTVLAAFDSNIEWNEAENFSYASGNPYRGPQAITQGIFMRLVQEWNGFRVTPQQFIDGGDIVAVLGRYTAPSSRHRSRSTRSSSISGHFATAKSCGFSSSPIPRSLQP